MIYKYAIDFGTTYSSIALRFQDDDEKKSEIIKVENGGVRAESIPSVFYVEGEDPEDLDQLLVGRKAKKANSRGPGQLLREVKLPLVDGKDRYEAQDGTEYPISMLAAALLEELKEAADEAAPELGIRPQGVVMGVPVDFPESAKAVLLEALVNADFYEDIQEAREGTEFVPEPVAAAVAYGVEITEGRRIMVFDFGGGTLDVAILELSSTYDEDDEEERLPHKVLAKSGLPIGGEALTRILFSKVFAPKYSFEIGKNRALLGIPEQADLGSVEVWESMSSTQDGMELQDALEELKCQLSLNDRVKDYMIRTPNCTFDARTFYQSDFTRAIEKAGILDQIEEAVKKCLNKAGLDKSDIGEVLMAGGSSLIPCVQDVLEEELGFRSRIRGCQREKIVPRDVLFSVVRGLSVYACRESADQLLVDDRVDHDYGVWDVKKEKVSVILPWNTLYSDTEYDRELASGGCFKEYEVVGQTASVDIMVYEQDGDERYKVGTIPLNRIGSGKFRIFMSANQGRLRVDIYDRHRREWYDDIPLADREFGIEKADDDDWNDDW